MRLEAEDQNVQASNLQPLTSNLPSTQNAEPSYEASMACNSDQIERPTSNIEHRTSNMDGAALYLFLYQGITLKM